MIRRDKPVFSHPTRHVGIQLEVPLFDAVKKLANSTGVSMNFAIRRALTDMVNAGQIPLPGEPRVEETEVEEMPVEQPLEQPERGSGSGIDSERISEVLQVIERLKQEVRGLQNRTLVYDPAKRRQTAPTTRLDRVR